MKTQERKLSRILLRRRNFWRGKSCRRNFHRQSQLIHQRIHYNSEKERRQRRLWSQFIAWYVGQLWKVFEEEKLRLQHYKRRRVWKSTSGLYVKAKKNLKKKGKGGRPNASVPLTTRSCKESQLLMLCFALLWFNNNPFRASWYTAIYVEATWSFDKLQILRNF